MLDSQIVCIDIGNSRISLAIFENNIIIHRFHCVTQAFQALQAEIEKIKEIKKIAIVSVVPEVEKKIILFCQLCCKNIFLLSSEMVPYLKIQYENPKKLGADRIANVVAALSLFPNQPLLIIDMGTATTLNAVDASGVFLGGLIMPGLGLSAKILTDHTALLPHVHIEKPKKLLGQSTEVCIQSGIYRMQYLFLKQIKEELRHAVFQGKSPILIGTGGYSILFKELFEFFEPDLTLLGLKIALEKSL